MVLLSPWLLLISTILYSKYLKGIPWTASPAARCADRLRGGQRIAPRRLTGPTYSALCPAWRPSIWRLGTGLTLLSPRFPSLKCPGVL